MSAYDPIARLYDAWSTGVVEDIAFYVDEALASGGPVVELGVGTGRIAIPTAAAMGLSLRRFLLFNSLGAVLWCGAYVAAADRAQETLREYPDTPSTQLALGVLMNSYDRLGLTQLRDDTQRVLRLNYPQSPYLNGPLPANHPSWWRLW